MNKLIVFLSLFSASIAGAQELSQPTATLPLEEMLRLHREAQAATTKRTAPPPIAAVINRVELSGRLLGEAVDAEASFDVTVLAGGGWVTVRLLHKDAALNITSIPRVEGAVVAVTGSDLVLISDRPGNYNFTVALMATATKNDRGRRAEINVGDAAVATMRVNVDENLFRINSPRTTLDRDGVMIYPEGRRFRVDWEQVAALKSRSDESVRQPIEPVITSAHASTVSTLAGKQVTRTLYNLRFNGTKKVLFRIPAGHALERVYLNGLPLQSQTDGDKLELEVSPSRAGDQGATVELVLVKEQESYFLSGRLAFEIAGASWTINELVVDLHLPEVFVYNWTGGSLAPIESSKNSTFAHEMPTPGKQLSFRQYLIAASIPHANIDYDVNIEGSYFR